MNDLDDFMSYLHGKYLLNLDYKPSIRDLLIDYQTSKELKAEQDEIFNQELNNIQAQQ